MALSRTIIPVLREIGHATVDQIAPHFPGCRRDQLQKALTNAANRGLVRLVQKGTGGPGTRNPGIWCVTDSEEGALVDRIVLEIEDGGPMTQNEVAAKFYLEPRIRVERALDHAVTKRYLACERRMGGNSIYRAAPPDMTPSPNRVCSVWEYAQRAAA